MKLFRSLREDQKTNVGIVEQNCFGIRGLVAMKDFIPGDPVCIYSGEYLTLGEGKERQMVVKDYTDTNYQVQLKVDRKEDEEQYMIVDCSRKGGIGGLANHLNGGNNCRYEPVGRPHALSSHESNMISLSPSIVCHRRELGNSDTGRGADWKRAGNLCKL